MQRVPGPGSGLASLNQASVCGSGVANRAADPRVRRTAAITCCAGRMSAKMSLRLLTCVRGTYPRCPRGPAQVPLVVESRLWKNDR